MTQLAYSYLAPSTLEQADGVACLDLATSGGSGAEGALSHPYFFSGFVEHPLVVAQCLLVLARVARTRFYTPPEMLAGILAAADPVVTSTPEGLRMECFSACCGVHARFDLDASALDSEHTAPGVTNVDVNPPLRQALAGLRPCEPLHLEVGSQGLRVRTMDDNVVEQKVALPTRWLKGFAESQMLSASMTLRHELTGAAVRQFLQGLPRQSSARTVLWATRVTRGLRLASRPTPGAACVAGPERLRVLEPLLRFATALRAYGPEVDASSMPVPSVWVLELPGGRLSVSLSPEKSRGFSGEGAVLHALSGQGVAEDADLVSALLAFEPRIDVPDLAAQAGLTTDRVDGALALLASSGQVGYDVTTSAYFHRPLPVRSDALTALHPRLAHARTLLDTGAITPGEGGRYTVRSKDTDYQVRTGDAAQDDRCTCPWYARYRGTRGPCKHVLAVRIWLGQGQAHE